MTLRHYAVIAFAALIAPAGWARVTPAAGSSAGPTSPAIIWPSCGTGQEGDERADFSIDGTRGAGSGKFCYGKHDVARVKLFNKNPFSFEYVVKKDEKVVSGTAVSDFLKEAVTLGFLKLPETKPAAGGADDKKALAKKCPGLADFNSRFVQLSSRVKNLGADIERAHEQQEAAALLYQHIKPTLESPVSACAELRNAAETFVFQPTTLALQEQNRELDDIDRKLKDLDGEIEKARKNIPECQTNEVSNLQLAVQSHLLQVPDYQKAIKTLLDGNKPFDTLRAQIAKIAADPHAFYEIVSIGPLDQDTDVTLTVERKGPTAKDKTEKIGDPFKLEFRGDPRLVLAAGAAATRMRTRSFSIVKGFALNRDGSRVNPGSTTPENIVSVDESSPSRVTPMLVLHGRLANLGRPWCRTCKTCTTTAAAGATGCRRPAHGIWASVGMTANSTDKGTDLEFLAGLSADLIENTLFLTVGRYWGKVQDIQDTLYPGAKVPDGVTSLPLQKIRRWAWGVALSYKFK
ncbi:MAG TPA: hypothetical protein VHR45_09465 [Thermoanaerobaculia bacterium]|nr:hypothetical protein [Thermoanaerobaculia bacterium]